MYICICARVRAYLCEFYEDVSDARVCVWCCVCVYKRERLFYSHFNLHARALILTLYIINYVVVFLHWGKREKEKTFLYFFSCRRRMEVDYGMNFNNNIKNKQQKATHNCARARTEKKIDSKFCSLSKCKIKLTSINAGAALSLSLGYSVLVDSLTFILNNSPTC